MRTPIKIKRLNQNDVGTGLAITWNDGQEIELPAQLLRKNCPCAGCREARGDGESHARPLTAGATKSGRRSLTVLKNELRDEINLVEVWAVGQYAIGMRWGDGHATGIYIYQLLDQLGGLVRPASSESQVGQG